MPPTSFRKRHRSPTPEEAKPVKKKARTSAAKSTSVPSSKTTPKSDGKAKSKPTLFDAADAGPVSGARTKEENRRLLDKLGNGGVSGSGSGSGSELSELGVEDDGDGDGDGDEGFEFEDVDVDVDVDVETTQPKQELASKRKKVATAAKISEEEDSGSSADNSSDDDDDGDEGHSFEDALTANPATTPSRPESEIADINISVHDDGTVYSAPLVSAATGKKAPSKKEREARVLAHEMHVQALMWHHAVRNAWCCDAGVQGVLVAGLSPGVREEVARWRKAMGWEGEEKGQEEEVGTGKKGGKGGKGTKGGRGEKGKAKGRDWGAGAKGQEKGVPDLSGGDPLLRLLRILIAYWRKRFTITAPGLRKLGYMPLKRLRDEIRGWQGSKGDFEEYGERIESKAQFRKAAKDCEGSRDVGAQLFVALLRGLGIETRMVANLQPVGIGFGKAEEAEPKRNKKEKKAEVVDLDSDRDVKMKGATPKKAPVGKKTNGKLKAEKPSRKSGRGGKSKPIDLDGSDSELSELSDSDAVNGKHDEPTSTMDDDGDDDSVVDITPAKPKPNKKYDRDLAFPNYWAEVLSPVSNTYIPVDPLILATIASNAELLLTFEPRGKKADKAKQGICYTIAHSPDGSAKDVTVRYLKKHQLPGKTKGLRVGPEKIAIRNKHGKVRKYEEYDWFKTVLSGYTRPHALRTPADDLEESTDLKPFKPATAKKEVEKESLAWYKASADFCLEHLLRREEALLPDAEPVKEFTAGKGDKSTTYPVYKRSDVVACKTVESWHKEGRALLPGQQARKLVPMRAVTLVRKREMEDAKRETGEPLKQGLYSREQTDWIIPPPIVDGKIPKNAFGNMDVYVPTMVPAGAVHLPLKGSAKLCRKLEIDYAEACTGFEFGKQRAVPVLTGVVVAEQYEVLVRDAWREEQKEVRRKEDEKRRALSLGWWRKMVMGLRIVERMREDYAGLGGEESNPFVRKAEREGRNGKTGIDLTGDGEGVGGGGGFFVPGHEEEEVPQTRKRKRSPQAEDDDAGGFLPDADEQDAELGGGFLIEDDAHAAGIDGVGAAGKGQIPITPVSLQAMHKKNADSEADDDDDEEEEEEEEEEEKEKEKDSTKPTDPAPKSQNRRRPAAAAAAAPKPKPPRAGKTPAKPSTRRTKKATTPTPTPSESSSSEEEEEGEEEEEEQSEPGASGEEDDSSLSELDDVSSGLGVHADDDDDEAAGRSSAVKTNGKTASGKGASSPRVVVRGSRARGKGVGGGKGKGKRATPVTSRYFASRQGGDAGEEEVEEESSGAESEEVVRPRSTTARTRGRA